MTRTINKILWKNKLWKIQREYFLKKWIINWCWWKDWFNFDKIFDNISEFKNFNIHYISQLKEDIKEICYVHDLDFYFQRWFYKSNLKFAYRLARLLSFAWFIEKIVIFIITLSLLNKYWKKYYITK